MKISTIALASAFVSVSSAAPAFDILQWGSDSLEQIAMNIGQLSSFSAGGKTLVNSETLQGHVKEENLRVQADKFYEIAQEGIKKHGHPTRVIGSGGHYATIGYIVKTLKSLGSYYDVSVQSFKAPTSAIYNYSLTVDDEAVINVRPFALTPPTHHKKPVTGPFVLVEHEGCEPSDYPKELNGGIALVSRGTCAFGDNSSLAGLAGASAVVIYNNVPGEGLFSGTIGTIKKGQVATLGVTYEQGIKWAQALKEGATFNATAWVDSYVKNAKTLNIIAQTTAGDPENVVMLGAHSDSVAAGPGINDDGSGSISLLEVATALTNYTVNNQVRFAWWAAEEEGLLGSDYYVSQLTPEENSKIRVFMDYDMMASPNFAYQVYDANNEVNPPGSGELKQLYIDYYNSQGVNHTLIPFDGRSDYDGFIKNGIPGGGVATGAEVLKTPEEAELFGGIAGIPFDPCYHELCDDTNNVNYTAWVLNTKLIAHSVATYAASFEGFPKRTPIDTSSLSATEASLPYHGPNLVL